VLDEFVTANHAAIIDGARARVAERTCPQHSGVVLYNGIPAFLEQLVHALHLAQSTNLIDHEQIGQSAGRHGNDLLRMGLTIGQVVHDYGDVCQTITEIAVRQGFIISTEEFRTLNLCLDDAIAGAVTEYARQRERTVVLEGAERLGLVSDELRTALNTAALSFASLQSGRVAAGGSTALVLSRSLLRLRDLIDRSLVEIRLASKADPRSPFLVAELIEELEIGAFTQAQAKGLHFAARTVDRTVMIEGDRQMLMAALANLLDNACKFTRKHSGVTLTTHVTAERVSFDVEDECGGLPPGKLDELVRNFAQQSDDRRGLGLGLFICIKAAQRNGGQLHVRDVPGRGCVFTLDLPRFSPSATIDSAT
jgi:signal transduction histidine kinase